MKVSSASLLLKRADMRKYAAIGVRTTGRLCICQTWQLKVTLCQIGGVFFFYIRSCSAADYFKTEERSAALQRVYKVTININVPFVISTLVEDGMIFTCRQNTAFPHKPL